MLWYARPARKEALFRGTRKYSSPNTHFGLEQVGTATRQTPHASRVSQGRRDDIWGLLYVLLEMCCKLPWQV